MPELTQSSLDTLLGRLVVEKGLATPEEVQHCQERLRHPDQDGNGESSNQQSLAEVLVAEGITTRKQIDRLRPELEQQKAQQQIPGYTIVEKLGSGAMATVYKAKQLSLDRWVAIKILPRKYTNNPQFVERFYAEGKAAAKLNHPNIVQAIDVGKAGEFHYFVMEFVEGRTVFDDITEKGPYSEAEALKIIIQITRALEHAHRAGFIHRDVKPKNIMLTPDGQVKLADMGLARAVSDREAAEAEQGKAFGTPYYISPEQIRGEVSVDVRADLYSLGATLYHMVTGQVPFEGANPSAVMHKHLRAELVPPDHVRGDLSSGISEIVEVCMAKDRNQRYATASDLLQDLEAVGQGEPPLQAREVFDLSALAALESGGQSDQTQVMDLRSGETLTASPIFWIAVAGWIVAAALLGLVALMLAF